ncbi:TetR/AcrR family transcriptional regulator [Actinomadura hibisca]|uniref:TetR/AcrR family transcriptional regulator n=1 Tax=Actinomadura hibisca TaxID=68565 RepID=UPI001C3F1DA5|nr:TetR/AcrR family transcriptional regulator [Actinomadura hibisca]
MSTDPLTRPRRGDAGIRILQTASRLFYAEGVHTVGVDRIIAETGVAKATFYHHFPAKDDLVLAYVAEQSRAQRGIAAGAEAVPPREAILTAFERMCTFGADPAYRGCPFINAAAEFHDPAHPVRRAVAEHRDWCRRLFRDLLAADGHPDPERAAGALLLLKDGLGVGFDLDDPAAVGDAVRAAVHAVLDAPARDGAR